MWAHAWLYHKHFCLYRVTMQSASVFDLCVSIIIMIAWIFFDAYGAHIDFRPVARSHDGLSLWLVRWLLFRLMFASGVVKLTSQCPTWWQLTALNYHYESQVCAYILFTQWWFIHLATHCQCIPTPLSWYAHQLPEWFQKMCVVGTYFIEVAAPVFFFLPVRSLRLLGFMTQVSCCCSTLVHVCDIICVYAFT